MTRNLPAAALAMVLAAGLGACHPKPAAATRAPSPTQLSVQHVMDEKVDPSADAIWESVGTVETKSGVEQRQPRGDAEWSALQGRAATLIEGAKLLQTPRPVGANGRGLADASTPGTRTAVQIEADIKADPARFAQAAARLDAAALEAQAAIRKRDPQALIVAGAEMDAACEACHAAYWYPRTPPSQLPDRVAFGREAQRP